MDSTAGSPHKSAALISELNREPDRTDYRRIEMMMTWTTQRIEMYKVKGSNIGGIFSLPTFLSKVNKAT